MTKYEAIVNIINDARSRKGSRTSLRRVESSLRILGLDGDDLKHAMTFLDYWDTNGNPYAAYAREGR